MVIITSTHYAVVAELAYALDSDSSSGLLSVGSSPINCNLQGFQTIKHIAIKNIAGLLNYNLAMFLASISYNY